MGRLDFYQHVYYNVNCLKCIGLWFYIPYSVNSIWFWTAVLSRMLIGSFAFIISTGGQIVYMVRLVRAGNFNILDVTGILNLVITEMLIEILLLDLFMHRGFLTELINELDNEEFQCHTLEERRICDKAIKLSQNMFKIILCCTTFDVFVHSVVVPAIGRFETLPLKMDLIFFDVNDPKYFDYVCAYQILYKPILLALFAALKTLPWAAMSFTMSQLDVLIHNFVNMKELVKSTSIEMNCDKNEAFRRTFRKQLLHHSAILRFINKLQATYSGQLSAYLLMSTTVIGTTALQFFSIQSPMKNLTDVIWLFAFFFIFVVMLFVDCYFGNCITDKCAKISTCIFSCPWTNLDDGQKKSLIIFMTKAQIPVVINAVKHVPVSLETFTKVMNWTYKGFAVMNQMK